MRRSRVRALLTAVLVSMSLFAGTGAALAAGPVDDSGYTQAERDTAQEKAAKDTAGRTCKLFLKGPAARWQEDCTQALTSQFTLETIPKLAATSLCGAVMAANKVMGAGCMAVVATQTDAIQGWFWEAYEAALSAAEVAGTVVTFIANPQFGWQAFLNGMKEDAVSMFSSVMKSITATAAFDPSAQWWRDTYAAAAGIGMVLLAIGLFSSAWQHSRGLLGPVEARDAMLLYPMIAVVMTVFGPPLAWSLTYVANGLSHGIIDWMGPDVVTFLERGAGFVFLTSKIPGGGVMGFIIFLLLVVGALGVWGMFLFQTVSAYVLGAVTGAAWGMSANPRWRAKALAVPMFVVGLIFAQPAMLFVLGVVTKMTNAIDLTPSADEGLRVLTNALMTVIALVIVAFSPIALLKWFPLLPDGTDSVRSSGPVGLTAAVGAAGSTATSAAMMRARGGGGGGTRGAGKTPAATGGPPPAPAAPTGPGSLSPRNPAPGGSGAAMGMGGRTGGGRALTGGGARTAAGGGTRTAAGGGSRAAAGAAGGAASGGALLAAQLAAGAANAAVQKARETADAATPEVRS